MRVHSFLSSFFLTAVAIVPAVAACGGGGGGGSGGGSAHYEAPVYPVWSSESSLAAQPKSGTSTAVRTSGTGRVYCLADARFGAIKPGDLLTTSGTPGHAMKVADHDRGPKNRNRKALL